MAKRNFLADIDFNKNQALNMKLQNLGSPPTLAVADEGFIYWNTGDDKAYMWTGTAWKSIPYVHPNHTGDVTSNGDSGTTITAHAVTNAKMATMATMTIKGNNTGISADPLDLTVSQVSVMLADTSITLGGGSSSNSVISSQLAVKTYVDNLLAANQAMVYKGTLGVGGTITVLPTTYNTGWSYKIITVGTYAGKVCEIGDLIIAITGRTGSGNLDADWTVVQSNIDGAVTGPISAVTNNFAAFNGTTGKIIKDSGVAISSVGTTKKYTQLLSAIGTTFAVTHSLGTDYVICQVSHVATGAIVECEMIITSGVVTFNFNTSIAANAYRVTIIG